MQSGLNLDQALAEARRCLHCGIPGCRKGCPISNNIPDFIQAFREGNIGAAYEIISERSNLPAICGRVCPHEKQCEAGCVLTRSKRGIKIGALEMFIADFCHEHNIKPMAKSNGARGKVAVIGSGPAGLTVAGDLAKQNFAVTVFERQSEPGGVLMFGIPEFRLSKEVVRREIDQLRDIGVEFRCNAMIGPDFTVDDIFAEGFDAIFMGTGTAMPRKLDIPGKDLSGIVTADFYLRMVRLVEDGALDASEILIPEDGHMAIIGAGNVSMDVSRTAIRRGAKKVSVIFRRTEDEITAFPSEYNDATSEGVEFIFLHNPEAYISQKEMAEKVKDYEPTAEDPEHTLGGLLLDVYKKKEDGEVEATGEKVYYPCDSVVLAIGNMPASRIVSTTKGIKVDERGFVITRQRPYGMTTRMGVFSGGDVVHGPATVVLAMKESKKVAAGIAMYVDAKHLLAESADETD